MSSIMKRIEEYMPDIMAAGERAYDQRAFKASIAAMFAEDPAKLKCLETQTGKQSILNSLRRAATTGLSLNPQAGKSAIIVYYSGKQKAHIAQYQIMKNGMIDLVMATGKVKFITADTVFKNDKFKIKKTVAGDEFEFEPCLDERGPMRGVFAAMVLNDGVASCTYMSVSQVEHHRDIHCGRSFRNDDGEEKKGSAWVTSFEGMALKTVMKKMLRNAHIASDSATEDKLREALGMDDHGEAEFADSEYGRPDHKGYSATDLSERMNDHKTIDVPVDTATDPEPEESKPQPKALPSDSPFK